MLRKSLKHPISRDLNKRMGIFRCSFTEKTLVRLAYISRQNCAKTMFVVEVLAPEVSQQKDTTIWFLLNNYHVYAEGSILDGPSQT